MSGGKTLTVHTDGGARGNPGPAAFAYVIEGAGSAIEEAGVLGKMTNNQAEYIALIKALEHCARLGTDHHIHVLSDSELMVKQLNGQYRVKNEGLRPYYEQAQERRRKFASFVIKHVRREHNKRADQLYNEALDGKRSFGQPASIGGATTSSKGHDADTFLREKALQCLTDAAKKWSTGDPTDPDPSAVLVHLFGIIEALEHKK